MRLNTTLVLAVCALLIVNSHLEAFYPAGFQFLAADGLLGNSLFYMLSGFGIQSSLMSREQGFGSYIRRRILRIYPGVILVVAILFGIVGGGLLTWTLRDYFNVFIWPTPFTYVKLIVLFYPLGYLLFLPRSARVIGATVAVLWLIYLLFYMHEFPTLVAAAKLSLARGDKGMIYANYASLFCLGMLLAALGLNLTARGGLATWAALVTVLLLYFGIKFLMVVYGWHSNFYAVLHVLVFLASPLLMLALGDFRLLNALQSVRPLWMCLAFVGGLTLEYYLVHAGLITVLPIASIVLPLNFVVLLALTSVLAFALRFVTDRLASRLEPQRTNPQPAPNLTVESSRADGSGP